MHYFDTLAKNVHEQLSQSKQEVYTKIELMFSKYESKVLREVEDYYRSSLVYDQEESETIREFITERIDMIYSKVGLLKGDQCLAALIKFYDSEQHEYEAELKEVASYLDKHRRMGQVDISLNYEAMN